MKHEPQRALPLVVLAMAVFSSLAARTPATAQAAASSEAYGYFRTVEGSSLLSSREPEETRDLEINLPILSGDAVQVGGRSRVEAVLADGSVVRLEAGSELVFDRLARSPDSPATVSTRLVLLAGEMQIRVPEETAASTPVEIENATARIYLIRGGSYWIGVSGTDGTRLIVREGAAEVLTEEGSRIVQSGEELEVSNRYGVETRVARARYERSIERWARDLEQAAYVADHGPVEQPLRYQAAPLARSGSWVRVDGRVAWRPRVRHGWRPFTDGHWVYTPSGLTWVAATSWGYVTSHYGTWDHLPAYGWCWFPGSVYSPAWVYWYWGPTHAAWVPYGYYARHYGPRYGWRLNVGYGYGLRFGVYGYAGGGWSVFADWTFCPLGYFGRRGGRHYYRSGHELAYGRRAVAVPRGIITTDTRGLDRAVWTRPYEVRRRLGEIHRGTFARDRHGADGDLPDVTSFVARGETLPANLHALVKPRLQSDHRPALNRIDRPIVRDNARTADGRVSTRETVAVKPARVATGRVATGRDELAGRGARDNTGEIQGGRRELDGNRFEVKPVRRPTEFERASTTVYRSPGSQIVRRGETSSTRHGGDRSLSGTVRPRPELPVGTDRSPTAYGRQGETTRAGVERPTVFPRKPAPVYDRPGGEDGDRLIRKPVYVRPSTETGATRSPVASHRVESSRETVSSSGSSSSRVQPAPSRSSGRSSGSRARSAPSRSSGSRAESTPSRSSGSRVQSSSSRSSGRSGASDRARSSRRSAREKDG